MEPMAEVVVEEVLTGNLDLHRAWGKVWQRVRHAYLLLGVGGCALGVGGVLHLGLGVVGWGDLFYASGIVSSVGGVLLVGMALRRAVQAMGAAQRIQGEASGYLHEMAIRVVTSDFRAARYARVRMAELTSVLDGVPPQQ